MRRGMRMLVSGDDKRGYEDAGDDNEERELKGTEVMGYVKGIKEG